MRLLTLALFLILTATRGAAQEERGYTVESANELLRYVGSLLSR